MKKDKWSSWKYISYNAHNRFSVFTFIWLLQVRFKQSLCYTIIKCKYNSMITIQYKYISVLILSTGQLGALVKYTSRLEGNNIGRNWTTLIRTSNKYCNKYKCFCAWWSGNMANLFLDASGYCFWLKWIM